MKQTFLLIFSVCLISTDYALACSVIPSEMTCPSGQLFSTFTCKCESEDSEFYPKINNEINVSEDEAKLVAPKTQTDNQANPSPKIDNTKNYE